MIRKSLFITGFVFFLSSVVAHGSNWTEITVTGKETKYFIDKDSIRHFASGVIRVWTQIKFQHTDKTDSEKEIIQYLEFDCNEKNVRVLQKDIFYSNGEHDHFGESDERQYIPPDTLLETTLNYLCKRQIK